MPSEADPLCALCVGAFPRWEGFSCRVCGIPLPDGGARCDVCRRSRRSFRFCRSGGLYDGPLRDALLRFKYGAREALGRPLGQWLALRWRERPELGKVDAVTAVPLHFLRRHARGYNQSELLALSFCAAAGLPYLEVLRRARWTKPQTRLGRDARRENVAQAFRVVLPESVAGKKILLIDDVCTTGATLDAAAAALRRAGARWVAALTAARQT
ncbi:MAG: ComF family protein [Elusimicrobia bacterium]|nr:ComF family protein [Elusimicrobiota bacterium]